MQSLMNSSYANSRIVRTQFLRVVRTQSLMNSSPGCQMAISLTFNAFITIITMCVSLLN